MVGIGSPHTQLAYRIILPPAQIHPQPVRYHFAARTFLRRTLLDGVVKDAVAELSGGDKHKLDLHFMRPALAFLHEADPGWTSEWVATRIAEGVLYGHEEWLPFATDIPDDLVEAYLHRLGTEDFERSYFEGMIAVIAARSDATLSAQVFAKLRECTAKWMRIR